MTSCSLGLRRGEGAPPYRGDITPAKDLSYTNKLPAGGRGRPPLLRSIESKYGGSRLARGGSLLADLPAGAPCHRRLARRGSLLADLPAGAPCHRRLARRGSLPSPTCPRGAPCHRRLARGGLPAIAALPAGGSLPSPTCPQGLPAIADLPAGAPCHRRLAHGGSSPCCLP